MYWNSSKYRAESIDGNLTTCVHNILNTKLYISMLEI